MKHIQEDKIISEFLDSLGPWKDFVIIGGGFALFVYKLYLADSELKSFPIGTRDIDSLIPRRAPGTFRKNIAQHLREAGFTHIFKDLDIPPTESYIKEINGVEVEIDFLTDNSTRDDKNKNIVISGVVAQPLSYLTLSLHMTMEFQTYTSKMGRVVSPEAWIFHKGLTFSKRKTHMKMLKDLYGIWYVASQLGDFSEQALTRFHFLTQEHLKWFETFKKNLRTWMENASPSDWLKLESQDSSGRLKKLNFKRIVTRLFGEGPKAVSSPKVE